MGTIAPQWVGIDSIVVLPEYQMREKLSASTVTEYADLIQANGSKWPFSTPCSIICVKGELILTDGFHRVAAMRKADEDQVCVVITDGTKTDALKAALSANISHGLRRSNADKRRAVVMALADATLQKWSDRKIAELCGVSDPFVGQIRGEVQTVSTSPVVDATKKTGTDGVSQPATKADAEMQRQKIVAAIIANEGDSDRKIAELVGCDHKTVGKVRREMEPATLPAAASCDSSSVTVESDEEQDLPVVVEDDDDDPPDIAELFAAAKAEFRELLREIPAIHRRSVMRQVYEQLITEEVEQW
jgi:ParB-like chromosome segregation protein Spo0J